MHEPLIAFQRLPVHEVMYSIAPPFCSYQACGSEDPKMLRDCRLGYAEQAGQGIDAQGIRLPLIGEKPQQIEPGRISQSGKER